MSTKSRNKGSGYEREVAALFSDALDLATPIKRKLGQSREAGNDLDCGPLVIEIKRRRRLATLTRWLNQARTAALGRAGHCYPVVVMREDSGKNMLLLALDDFLELAGPEIRMQMREGT